MAKTFQQLRSEWMKSGKSDSINYCMPVNIGVISQHFVNPDEAKIKKATKEIMNQLEKWFGKFSAKARTKSHHQLIVMKQQNDPISKLITDYLKANYNAMIVPASEQDIKKYCWITIAAWDGTTRNNPIYPSIKEILSTINTVEEDYQLRFPENRPIFQIVLPISSTQHSEMDYTFREIYPHMLETINKDKPWFSRNRFIPQSRLDKWRDSKRRNFKSNAMKLKKFNKKIIKFSNRIDKESKYIYDLLPWQHFEEKYKNIDSNFAIEDHVNITNLREIFYDLVSMNAQNSEIRQSKILLAFASIGLISFAVYSDAPFSRSVKLAFLGIFAFCMLTAYLIYLLRVQISGSHKTYLEFRALAEGMRVQCYWYASGINQSVGTKYTVKFQKDMQWAKQAFNAWYISDYLKYRFPSVQDTPSDDRPYTKKEILRDRMIMAEWLGTLRHEFTEDGMTEPKTTVLPDEIATYDKTAKMLKELSAEKTIITQYQSDLAQLKKALGKENTLQPGGQYGYFYKTTRLSGKKNKQAKRNNIFSLIAWIVCAIVLVAVIFINSSSGTLSTVEDYVVCAMGIFTIFPLILSAWSSIKAYGELASKYSYCELLAEKALQDYQAVEKKAPQKIKKIFEKYGVEALEENAEWLMIKNDREPTVPNG